MRLEYSGLLKRTRPPCMAVQEVEPCDLPLVEAVKRDGILQRNAAGELCLYHGGASPAVMRSRIERLKDYMLTQPGQMALEVKNELAGGLYVRRLAIPKGTVLVGKIHLRHCFNVVEVGDISVLTEHGSRRIKAGYTGISAPGIQKVGLAHEDTVFVNVFRTDKTEIAEIEAEIAAESFGGQEMVCL